MYPAELSKPKIMDKKLVEEKDYLSNRREIVGLVVFDGEKFLLLHRVLHWSGWEFAKGGVKVGEKIEDAIKRELFEETGIINVEVVGKIDELKYFDKNRNIPSFVRNYLVKVSSNNKISFENQALVDGERVVEHDDFKWCFPLEAVKLLKHHNMKRTMKRAIVMLGLSASK